VQGTLTLDGVALAVALTRGLHGTLTVRNGLTLLQGTTVTVADVGEFIQTATRLVFDGAQTLGGTGEVILGGTADNNVLLPVGRPLTLGPNITLHGPGGATVGAGTGDLVNAGTIRADTAGRQITVTGSTVTNAGTVGAVGGSLSVSNLGPNAGTIEVEVGGLVTINGAFTNDATGTIRAAIGGTTTSQSGRVTGAATLHGTLDVSLANNFTPSPGTTFDIIAYRSHTDDFDTVTLPPTLQASVDATPVRLTALNNVNNFSAVMPLALLAEAGPESDGSRSLAGALARSTATSTRPPVTGSNPAKPSGAASLHPVPVTALHDGSKMAHANVTSWPARQAAPAWLRRFPLDLAQDDPNHDLRIVLPTTVDHAPAHEAGAHSHAETGSQHPSAPALLRRGRA